MIDESANETDVREEIASPLLHALGYARGSANDIAREQSLVYERLFLGRRKNSDPPLRGRADYVLSVAGAGRWVLEVKSPSNAIDEEVIGQAISYARHPEVSASYAVVLNGLRLTVHHSTQRSTEKPLVDLEVISLGSLVEKLRPLLSPASIRRDCTPPPVDLNKPLSDGLRSRVDIVRGEIVHNELRCNCNIKVMTEQMNELSRRLRGFRVNVTGGSVVRDENSRIRARLKWALPHDEMIRFALDKRLMDADYLALSDQISTNPEDPTVFDVVGCVEVQKGESLFSIIQWNSMTAGMELRMSYVGRATGYIEGFIFQGTFGAKYQCDYPSLPHVSVEMELEGTFGIEVDNK